MLDAQFIHLLDKDCRSISGKPIKGQQVSNFHEVVTRNAPPAPSAKNTFVHVFKKLV